MYGPVFTRFFIYWYYYYYYAFFGGGACRLPGVSNYSLVSDRMVKQ